jgi:hypothetical protein
MSLKALVLVLNKYNATLGPMMGYYLYRPSFHESRWGTFLDGERAKGFPGSYHGRLSTGYLDLGAVQRQEPAGAKGGGAWSF